MFSKNTESPRLLLAANTTNGSFQISSPTTVTAAVPAGCASVNIPGGLSAVLTFFGEGSDTQTFDFRIYVRSLIRKADGDTAAVYTYRCLGFGTATLSGTTVSLLGVTQRVVDTLTWTACTSGTTVKGSAAAFATASGDDAGTVYSPGDDTPAELLLSNLRRGEDLVIDFDMTGATSANVAAEFSRL